ncbi:MAG: hypothetical protein FJ038_12710 [Chloroflexi bacterium]|nr:hypothetical protein [Chloroflexota bacterium]
MNDFKDFLEKVLAPVQADAEARPSQSAPAPAGEAKETRAVPDGELERRYVEVMNALLADAQEHNAVGVFTEVVAWKLAVVAFHWGPRAAGDVVRRLGAHLGNLAEAAEAQREADSAKEAGHRPN